MLQTFRTFTNKIGATFDALKTSVIFAEDMNLIKNLFTFSVYGGHVTVDISNVASDPTTPTIFETITPTMFTRAGDTINLELFFECPNFDSSAEIRLEVDSHQVMSIPGDNAYPANIAIKANIRLTRDNAGSLRGCVSFQISDLAIGTIYGTIPSFDFTINHPLNLYLVGANDGDVNLVGGYAKVEF